MKGKIISAMALGLLLLALTPGTAQAEEVGLSYDLNFSSNEIHLNTWSRLEVFVTNKGGGDIEGILTVSGEGKYRQEVFVEAGKSTSAIFYLPPTEMGWRTNSSNASITLNDARGRELQRTPFNFNVHNVYTNYVYVGVLGGGVSGFNQIASTLPNTRMVTLGPEHLNHSPFAENFSIIVINDPQTVMMNPQQQENLRLWVEQGGVLILGGGSSWQRTLDLVPAELTPIQPQGVSTVTAADLAALKLPVPIPQQNYSIALGESKGTVLQAAGDIPLLVQLKMGRGGVLWSALDLAASPLDSTGNQIAYWQQLLLFQPIKANPIGTRQSWTIDNIFNTIAQGEVASALSPLRIFLLLLVYILLAGPINWLVLRQLDRREWAWLTIPLLAIIVTTGAFAVGRGGRSSQQLLYQFNLIEVQSENLARVDGQGGVFVPNRGQVTLTSRAAALAPREGGVLTHTGDGARISYDNPHLWSVQRFMASDYLALPGNFAIAAKLKGANTLDAEIVNNSGHALFASYLRIGASWFQVGPLAAGEGVSLANITAQHYVDFDDIFQRYSSYSYRPGYEIHELLPSAPVLFIGFGEEGVLSVDGAGKTVPRGEQAGALDVWMQPLDLGAFDFGQGQVDIPRGILTPEIMVGAGGMQDRWSNHYELRGQGSLDLTFTLPPGLDYSRGQYYLNLQNFGGDARGSVLVYNHNLKDWQELYSLTSPNSSPGTIELEDPGALVLNQRLLVRVEYDGVLGFDSEGIDITVEGGRIND